MDYNIDTHPPARPIIEAIEDHVAGGVEDGNSIRRNGYTNDDQPVVRGQAEANALVYLYNGNQLASVRADAQGNWQAQLDLPQDGTYNLTAQAEDRADNRSQPSPKWTFHLDTLTPETPTFSYYDDNRGLYQGQFGRGKPTMMSGRNCTAKPSRQRGAHSVCRTGRKVDCRRYGHRRQQRPLALDTAAGSAAGRRLAAQPQQR